MSRRLRVGVDMHTAGGIKQGIRTHLLELYAEAVSLAPDLDFIFLGVEREILVTYHSSYASPNVHTAPMAHAGPAKRLLWQLPILQRTCSLDLLHVQYIMPVFNRCKIAVTIHDILFETYPAYFTPFFRFRSSLLMKHASRAADVVLTVSQFSKRELVERYQSRAADIVVTPNAADKQRFHPALSDDGSLSRRGLTPKSYVLSVGRLEPRKNYGILLRAFATLRGAPPLVIVGQRDFQFDEVFSLIEQLKLGDRVFILDDVDTDELATLYQQCLVFVYPSVAEGYGMPVMEAFSCGAPVICSDSTALTEIANDAALLVVPNSVNSLSEALSRVLADQELQAELSAAGLQRSNEYSWRRSASVLVESFRACVQ